MGGEGVQLISRLWTIIQSHWNHRNATLHETEALARLSGLEELKPAVCAECKWGLGDLPSVYTSYFLPPLAFILQKPTAYIKRWFLLIRSGRESCTIDFDIDIFSTDSSLRSWVGLRAIWAPTPFDNTSTTIVALVFWFPLILCDKYLLSSQLIVYKQCRLRALCSCITLSGDFYFCSIQHCIQARQILLD